MSERPGILVFAYSLLGHRLVEELIAANANILGAVTHRDNPGENLFFPSVADLAKRSGIPCRFAEDIDVAGAHALFGRAPLVFSFAYRLLLPPVVIDTELGAYNLHPSPLPHYRGRAPVNWMVLKGEIEGAATLHRMVERADAGEIIFQRRFPIPAWWTAYDVLREATEQAAIGLAAVLPALEQGTAEVQSQDISLGSYYGRRSPADGRIDWVSEAGDVYNLVRAVTDPYPGAFAHHRGVRLGVWWVWATELETAGAAPGTVLAADEQRGVLVACGAKAISLEQVEYEGRRLTGSQAVAEGLFKEGEVIG